jgi:hypothetical protein
MCESHFETDFGVEDCIQRSEDEDEMVVFFGEVDPRARPTKKFVLVTKFGKVVKTGLSGLLNQSI